MTEARRAGRPGTWVLPLFGTSAATVRAMRTWVTEHLDGLGDEHRDDVLLVATELLANAHDHGGGPRHLQLWHSLRPCTVRVEVADCNLVQPTMGESRLPGPRGRGLLLVDRLSVTWGVLPEIERERKTVWAQIPCLGRCPRPAGIGLGSRMAG
ncbi:ATP-binding protein [Amycolatopsis sp. NPDC051903]|uniref:ATP-binding protein n=1 Tax=Amycolatopsis sp. NPDC051903 TaxID=3363936 RepID=UPI0037BCD7FE